MPTEPTSNEEMLAYLEARWESVSDCVQDGKEGWFLYVNRGPNRNYFHDSTESEVLAAAVQFTKAHAQKIAEFNQAIGMTKDSLLTASQYASLDFDDGCETGLRWRKRNANYKLILALLERELATLKLGWKEQP